MAPLTQQSFRRTSVPEMTAETGADGIGSELVRGIGLFQLSMFGIGATIGTGIFVVLSQAVPEARPAVIWSFLIAGVVAGQAGTTARPHPRARPGVVLFRRVGREAEDYDGWAARPHGDGAAFIPPSKWDVETVGRFVPAPRDQPGPGARGLATDRVMAQ